MNKYTRAIGIIGMLSAIAAEIEQTTPSRRMREVPDPNPSPPPPKKIYEPEFEAKTSPLKAGQNIYTINGREYTARSEENAIKKAERYENTFRKDNGNGQ